jgi:hypothetical protein
VPKETKTSDAEHVSTHPLEAPPAKIAVTNAAANLGWQSHEKMAYHHHSSHFITMS